MMRDEAETLNKLIYLLSDRGEMMKQMMRRYHDTGRLGLPWYR